MGDVSHNCYQILIGHGAVRIRKSRGQRIFLDDKNLEEKKMQEITFESV